MIDATFVRSLGLIILAAAVLAVVARRFRLPGIVAYLVAGLILGPATGFVSVSDALRFISETGIVLLLFLVGLELSFEKIAVVGKAVLIAGLFQVTLTFALAFGLALWLGLGGLEAAFFSAALTLSSTVVVVKLLDEKREFSSLHGRISVGILLVQDIVVIILLTLLAGLPSGGGKLDVTSMLAGCARAFGGMILLLIVVLAALRWILPRVFGWTARSPETLFIWSLCWCFIVLGGAHLLHLSHETGAFMAGVALAQLPYSHDLRRRVHPLMNFFVAVFFVTLGINMTPGTGGFGILGIAAVCLFVLIGKPLIVIALARLLGFSGQASFASGIALGQISEFSFLLLAMGLQAQLVGPEILSAIGLTGLVTIAVSSCALLYHDKLYRTWRNLCRQPMVEDALRTRPKGHVIVVGMNTLGREIVQRLAADGEDVLAIDTDPNKLRDLPGRTLLGSVEYLAVLEEAELAHAKLLVSALQIEDANDLLAFRCREAGVKCSILGVDLSVVDDLLEMDVAYLMIPKVDGIKRQQETLQAMGLLP